MMRFAGCVLCLAGACQAAPDRIDPSGFPGALADSDVLLPDNQCGDRSYPFKLESRGYVEATLAGYGTFTVDDTTAIIQGSTSETDLRAGSIVLQACDHGPAPLDLVITLIDTIEPAKGDWPVIHRVESSDSGRIPPGTLPLVLSASRGALFSFVDRQDSGVPIRCDIQSEGYVRIDRLDAHRVRGTLDVIAGCTDATLETAAQLPETTRFQGWFEAKRPEVNAL